MIAVAVETEPTLNLGEPKILFQGKYFGDNTGTPYDIHPNGDRFLMLKSPIGADAANTRPREIIAVLNWFEELKDLVPVD